MNNSFEESMNRALFSQSSEKSSLDKLFAKDDIRNIRNIIKKDELTRSEALELYDYLASGEAKLFNLSDNHWYILNKYYVWIGEVVNCYELFCVYEDELDKKGEKNKDIIKLDRSAQLIFRHNKRLLSNIVKFMCNHYLNMARSTLSLGATGFLEPLKQKWEMFYGGDGASKTPNMPNQSGFFNLGKGGNS